MNPLPPSPTDVSMNVFLRQYGSSLQQHLFFFLLFSAELYCFPLIPCHSVHLSRLYKKKDRCEKAVEDGNPRVSTV